MQVAAERMAGRLAELSRGGDPKLRVLHAAALPPEEALEMLPSVPDPLVRLQRAFCHQDLGRTAEARELTDSLGGLPDGLEQRRRLLRLRPADREQASPLERELGPDRTERFASHTLAALHASQGDTETAVAMYEELLARNPEDAESRTRLRALLAGKDPVRPVTLDGWLTTVRAWREHLGA